MGRDDDTTTWSAKHTDFNTSALALAFSVLEHHKNVMNLQV